MLPRQNFSNHLYLQYHIWTHQLNSLLTNCVIVTPHSRHITRWQLMPFESKIWIKSTDEPTSDNLGSYFKTVDSTLGLDESKNALTPIRNPICICNRFLEEVFTNVFCLLFSTFAIRLQPGGSTAAPPRPFFAHVTRNISPNITYLLGTPFFS